MIDLGFIFAAVVSVFCCGVATYCRTTYERLSRRLVAENLDLVDQNTVLSNTLAAEQTFSIKLVQKNYEQELYIQAHSKAYAKAREEIEDSHEAIDRLFDKAAKDAEITVTDDVTMHDDGTFTHHKVIIQPRPEGGAIESPDPEWDAAHPTKGMFQGCTMLPDKPWPKNGGGE